MVLSQYGTGTALLRCALLRCDTINICVFAAELKFLRLLHNAASSCSQVPQSYRSKRVTLAALVDDGQNRCRCFQSQHWILYFAIHCPVTEWHEPSVGLSWRVAKQHAAVCWETCCWRSVLLTNTMRNSTLSIVLEPTTDGSCGCVEAVHSCRQLGESRQPCWQQ